MVEVSRRVAVVIEDDEHIRELITDILEKIGLEVIAASKGEGNAVKKKEDTHRMAEANKAFAHYRW